MDNVVCGRCGAVGSVTPRDVDGIASCASCGYSSPYGPGRISEPEPVWVVFSLGGGVIPCTTENEAHKRAEELAGAREHTMFYVAEVKEKCRSCHVEWWYPGAKR
jgi:hypothetical protein